MFHRVKTKAFISQDFMTGPVHLYFNIKIPDLHFNGGLFLWNPVIQTKQTQTNKYAQDQVHDSTFKVA